MEISPIVSVKITSQDAIIGDEMEKDTIDKPIIDHLNNSVVFRPIGVMYPTMTFGHLRSTIDLNKLQQLVGKICNISETIKGFSLYREKILTNDSLTDIPQTVIEVINNDILNTYPTQHFTSFMLMIESEFEEACERVKTTRRTLNEVFINDVMRSTKRNGFRRKRSSLAVGGFAAGLVMSIYNSVEIQRLSSEVEDTKQKQEFLIEDMEEVKEDIREHDKRMRFMEAALDEITAY